MGQREELIEQLHEGRAHVLDLLKFIDINQEIYPRWTAKELLAHFAGWDDATIAALKAHARGEVPATPADRGVNYYNAQTVSTREALDYSHVYREWEAQRAELIQEIGNMPEAKFAEPIVMPWGPTGSVAELIHIMADHEVEHAEEIMKKIGIKD